MMQGSGGPFTPAAGGPARHIPVLLEAALAALEPIRGNRFIDGTFGAGGYTRALLDAGAHQVLAIDRDPTAIAAGQDMVRQAAGKLILAQGVFSDMVNLANVIGFAPVDGIVLDVGVSSMQLDQAGRGFSFRFDGPLDMRMGGEGPTAADIVNNTEPDELANLIYQFGDERASRRIARAIATDRVKAPFETTLQLAGMIARIMPHKPNDIHPATRTFQALRIVVNDELGELSRALSAAEQLLQPGGRLSVVSFHSLEDRIVKQFLAQRSGRGRAKSRLLPGEVAPPEPAFDVPGRQPVSAGPDEVAVNPRSRSARLRYAIRTDAPFVPGSRNGDHP